MTVHVVCFLLCSLFQIVRSVTLVYSHSVEPRKLCVGVKYYIVHMYRVCPTTLMVVRAVYGIFAKGLGVCQKEGGEAVRSCRAAAGGGWVQEGDVPPPPHTQHFYLSEIHLHEL